MPNTSLVHVFFCFPRSLYYTFSLLNCSYLMALYCLSHWEHNSQERTSSLLLPLPLYSLALNTTARLILIKCRSGQSPLWSKPCMTGCSDLIFYTSPPESFCFSHPRSFLNVLGPCCLMAFMHSLYSVFQKWEICMVRSLTSSSMLRYPPLQWDIPWSPI